MIKCINWTRIVSIAGITFCSTLLATGWNAEGAAINAILLSLLSLFTEMKIESEPMQKVQRLLKQGLIL